MNRGWHSAETQPKLSRTRSSDFGELDKGRLALHARFDTGDHGNDVVAAGLVAIDGANDAPAAEHPDAVDKIEHLTKVVADQNQRDAAGLEAAHDVFNLR